MQHIYVYTWWILMLLILNAKKTLKWQNLITKFSLTNYSELTIVLSVCSVRHFLVSCCFDCYFCCCCRWSFVARVLKVLRIFEYTLYYMHGNRIPIVHSLSGQCDQWWRTTVATDIPRRFIPIIFFAVFFFSFAVFSTLLHSLYTELEVVCISVLFENRLPYAMCRYHLCILLNDGVVCVCLCMEIPILSGKNG